MPYNKPYRTVQQQIALLKQRGIVISDDQRAAHCLSRIGYYRLSAYWFPFRVRDGNGDLTNNVRANTQFETIISLYHFDKNLRMLVLDAIERIEIALRVHISLLLGQKSPQAHRNPTLLDGKFSRHRNPKTGLIPHQEWMSRIDNEFHSSKEEFVKHFKSFYPGEQPPIWIACEVWSFGSLSHLFSGLTTVDQNTLAREFGVPNGKILEKWIIVINVARNACAHHGRLWNKPTGVQPIWPRVQDVPDLGHISTDVKAQTRMYGALAILRYLMRSINPATQWSARLKALCNSFPNNPTISLASAGFPQNWEHENLWA
jgi:abortive infection bacteriophage resistance protein